VSQRLGWIRRTASENRPRFVERTRFRCLTTRVTRARFPGARPSAVALCHRLETRRRRSAYLVKAGALRLSRWRARRGTCRPSDRCLTSGSILVTLRPWKRFRLQTPGQRLGRPKATSYQFSRGKSHGRTASMQTRGGDGCKRVHGPTSSPCSARRAAGYSAKSAQAKCSPVE